MTQGLTCQPEVYSGDIQRAMIVGNSGYDLEAPRRGLAWNCREFQDAGSS